MNPAEREQYPYPWPDSPLIVVPYGDDWVVFDRNNHQMFSGFDPDEPLVFQSNGQAENFVLMLFCRVPLPRRQM